MAALSDLLTAMWVLYKTGALFVLVPALALVAGAVAGWLTPRTGALMGGVVGLVTGSGSLLIGFYVFIPLARLGGNYAPEFVFVLITVGSPLGGILAPIAILQTVRLWRKRAGTRA